jgi:hypothetical protein
MGIASNGSVASAEAGSGATARQHTVVPRAACPVLATTAAAHPDSEDHMYVGVGTILAIVLIVLLIIWVF